LCSKYFAEHFLKNKSGSILNIASRHGISGQLDCISYASSKAAIINITQAYSKLLAPFGTVNVISP
jgi:NAD(P)-dependent dehydrogenase (short-subunit alcohol dehydrogenase family)